MLVALVLALPARAAQLDRFLDRLSAPEIFPGAEHLGAARGTPPAAPAFSGNKLLGYVFLTADVVDATGYSGKPIYLAVAMDLTGEIVGTKLLEHSEPILLAGVDERRIAEFVAGYIGYNALDAPSPTGLRGPPVDIVSGASVTTIIMGDGIVRSAIRIARSRNLGPFAGAPGAERQTTGRVVDMAREGTRSWRELLDEGSIRSFQITVGQVNDAFAELSPGGGRRLEPGNPNLPFLELQVALVSAPVIGRSLLGDQRYRLLRERLEEGRHAILVMGGGRYSWRGSAYVRGGVFDRIALLQDINTIRFRESHHQRIGDLAAEDAPPIPEIGLFVVPDKSFDPAQPWRLQLLVQRDVGGGRKEFITFDLRYELPDEYLVPAPAPPAAEAPEAERVEAAPVAAQALELPLWKRIWAERRLEIGVVSVALGILTGAFFFQDWLVRRPRLHFWVRTVFLAWTLLWLGWLALAQLSVVNILTLTIALVTDFHWEFFLKEPLIFLLWSAVAAALLFWGRGSYCGWLCPFGALQEFVNRAARRLRIPQFSPPWGLHERLWPIKYMIFLGLFGYALYSLVLAEQLAEVEPFKTAIVLRFLRDWPFVLYAVGLLVAGLFVERFFCRYLCPLGAALAIPARMRTFEWLRRHKECGNPCQRCAQECPVQSIHPDGRINPNECIYCMHCQLLYWDEHKCPAMIQRRLRRERTQALSSDFPGGRP